MMVFKLAKDMVFKLFNIEAYYDRQRLPAPNSDLEASKEDMDHHDDATWIVGNTDQWTKWESGN